MYKHGSRTWRLVQLLSVPCTTLPATTALACLVLQAAAAEGCLQAGDGPAALLIQLVACQAGWHEQLSQQVGHTAAQHSLGCNHLPASTPRQRQPQALLAGLLREARTSKHPPSLAPRTRCAAHAGGEAVQRLVAQAQPHAGHPDFEEGRGGPLDERGVLAGQPAWRAAWRARQLVSGLC